MSTLAAIIDNIDLGQKVQDVKLLLEQPLGMVVLVLGIFVFLAIIIILVLRKRSIRLKEAENLRSQLLQTFKLDRSKNDNISDLIGKFANMVVSPGYYFYEYDHFENAYLLMNSRINSEMGAVGPAYSGLLSYKKETYEMPQRFETSSIPAKAAVLREGDVKLLVLPVGEKIGFICIGPVSRYYRLKRKMRFILNKGLSGIQTILYLMIQNDSLKLQVSDMEKKAQAISNMKSSLSDYSDILTALASIARTTSQADGIFVLKFDSASITMPVISVEEDATKDLLTKNADSFSVILDLIGSEEYVCIKQNDKDFIEIPDCIRALGIKQFGIVDISYKKFHGFACYYFAEEVKLESYLKSTMMVMVKKIGEVLENYQMYHGIVNSYVSILKMVAETLDNVSAHTVGRSEMMYRYAYVIGESLGLSDLDKQEIALAAYLSNIGVIGLSSSLFLKSDKYSDEEFEMMKLHCEVGASIIESTLGNPNIARYILEHHERIDGFGYPRRLKGDDISVGAKILAVVQFYTAKLIGREGRQPIAFYKGVEQLEAASGTQLDPLVVTALVRWLEEKKRKAIDEGTTLGPCWEMRCSPTNICSSCPIYGKSGRKCFEYPENNCKAHGNECDTCFVKTEFLERKMR